MSALFEENFEMYGGSLDRALEGIWAEFRDSGVSMEIPSWEENGRHWLRTIVNNADGARAVLASAVSSLGVFTIVRYPELPSRGKSCPIHVRDGSNNFVFALTVTPIGNIEIYNSSDVKVAETTVPCITASTSHKIQLQASLDGSTGAIEVRVGTVGGGAPTTVIDEENIALPGTAAQIGVAGVTTGSTASSPLFYNKCFAVYSLTGTYNSNWPSISDVVTLMINEDTATDNMTPRPRAIFGDGVARFTSGGAALYASANSTDFNFGTGDFTVEGYFRWETLPTGSEFQTLASLWGTLEEERGWRLRLNGPSEEEGGLQWEHTTDGSTGTRTVVHDIKWTPIVGHIYHIAVSRSSGVSRLFIDGVQQGIDVADTADIYDAAANIKFMLGNSCDRNDVGSFFASFAGALEGEIDEFRLTNGVGRYTANFTPAGPWPRDVGGDSDFNSVVYLAGYDNNLGTDEGPDGRSMSSHDSVARYVPQDGSFSYQAANPRAPIDDRYLEAELLPATGVLTLTDNPTDTETVTLGATTYEFVDTLASANDVLIGATLEDSLANLTDAINGGDGEGARYGTGTTPNLSATAADATPTVGQMTVTAIVPGTGGNSITSTETLANGSWSDTTLDGGADLPGASQFGIQSLPATVTGVRWIGVRNRSRVTQGAGKIQTTLDVSGSTDTGTERDLTSGYVNYVDRFEEDPNTSAALTPTSITNAQLKLERTE